MRIFVTGATGFIGRVVTERAIARGHTVHGLSRSEEGDARLRALGATAVRGELGSFDVLRAQSAQSDAVLHLAFIHSWTMDYEEILRADAAAVDAIGDGLRGSAKPLVTTSGTAFVTPDPSGGETTEDAPIEMSFRLSQRIRSERHALALAENGVHVSTIRLPPYVYGRGGDGFIAMLMREAAKAGESIYVGDGHLRTSGTYVDDAAELYLLAMKGATSRDIFNGVGTNDVTLRQLAEAIGAALALPVRSVRREEAEKSWGEFLTAFVQHENRPSNRKAVERLGWKPKGIDMLTDIRSGSYRDLAQTLRKG